MSGRFVLRRSGAKFNFILQAQGNFETLLVSESYESKAGAEKGINSVKTNAPIDARYEKRTSVKDQPYFVLKGGNGEIIGKSQMYSSPAARDKGISAMKANAPGANTVDET
jgi:uncharacterized protein YegP (UPF0339 family)